MSATIKSWYDFILQQMAAESYLEGWASMDDITRKNILQLGSNNPIVPENAPTTPVLPGATRMTAAQAADFLSRYTVIDHQPNTASGFSATLMRDNNTGEYTFSMRSTEYFDSAKGGDWMRDGLDGADGEINSYGFALGQILDMEKYYDQLQISGALPLGTKLNVTGYSLSGSLATVFTELHPSDVIHTYAFNSPGHGTFDISKGGLADVIAYFKQAIADALVADNAVTPHEYQQPLSTTNVYQDPRYLNAVNDTVSHFNLVGNTLSGYYHNLVGDGPVLSNDQITQLVGVGSNGDTANNRGQTTIIC